MKTAPPFAPGSSRESFLETVPGRDILGRLNDGLGAREPFLLLTGDAGTGKTALVHEAIARWGARASVAFIAYPALSGSELLQEVLLRLGADVPDGAGRPRLLAAFERTLADIAARGQVAVLVVDDAHALSPAVLEELRLLANAAQGAGQPFEVLLAGLPALEATLETPEMGALRQRLSLRAKLAPLSVGETRRYVRHRCDAAGADGRELFPRTTCLDLAALSGGVPRQINTLAAEALRLARAANESVVRSEHVQAAAEHMRGVAPVHTRDELDEDDGALVVAPMVAPPPVAASPARPVAPAPAHPVRAEAAEPKRAPVQAADSVPNASGTAAVEARPTPPVSQDPREWVARFVGDRGPLQIGSQSTAQSTWAMGRREPTGGGAGDGAAAASRRKSPVSLPPARPRRRGARRAVTVSLVAAMLMLAIVVLVIRAGGLARRHDAVAASAPAAKQVAGVQRAPVETRVSAPIAKPHGASAPEVAAPAEAPAASAAEPAPVTATPAAEGVIHGPYTIDVGGYLDAQEAADQRDRAQALTGIRGWVVAAPEGTSELNRVVLGMYRARGRADAAAQMLVRSKTLAEATVVHMPSRTVRR